MNNTQYEPSNQELYLELYKMRRRLFAVVAYVVYMQTIMMASIAGFIPGWFAVVATTLGFLIATGAAFALKKGGWLYQLFNRLRVLTGDTEPDMQEKMN